MTTLLASHVAMISRRSRCAAIASGEAAPQRPREVLGEIGREIGPVGQLGCSRIVVIERHLGVGEQHRRPPAGSGRFRHGGARPASRRPAGPRSPDRACRCCSSLRISRGCASTKSTARASVRLRARFCRALSRRQRVDRPRRSSRPSSCVALLHRQVARGHDLAQQDLDVDLVVGAVDAGRIVDEVGVERARRSGLASMRASWVMPRLPPSASTRQRSSLASMRRPSLARSWAS